MEDNEKKLQWIENENLGIRNIFYFIRIRT
jgi:hypothetical protein